MIPRIFQISYTSFEQNCNNHVIKAMLRFLTSEIRRNPCFSAFSLDFDRFHSPLMRYSYYTRIYPIITDSTQLYLIGPDTPFCTRLYPILPNYTPLYPMITIKSEYTRLYRSAPDYIDFIRLYPKIPDYNRLNAIITDYDQLYAIIPDYTR